MKINVLRGWAMRTVVKYPIPELYIGTALALVVIGVIWMLADAVLTGAMGRTSTLVFLAGLLMIFLPVAVGVVTEYVRGRKGGAE